MFTARYPDWVLEPVARSAELLFRPRNLHCWLGEWIRQSARNSPIVPGERPLHLFLSVCDHYEPEWGRPAPHIAEERVMDWVRRYPEQHADLTDSRGRPPQHSFFFPADEYRPEYLDGVAELCEQGFGDAEIHLHHDQDTADNLRQTLSEFADTLHRQHGLLRLDPRTGRPTYGFIHGNWSLCHSRPDGRWCGVPEEIDILRETGCYADFTLPSAPSDTQTRTINSIYYATNRPGQCKSHDVGTPAAVLEPAFDRSLLMIQGPLLPNWNRRKFGLIPRIENGDLTAANPPTLERLRLWMQASVIVQGRPDWLFIKLHTHGCQPANQEMWLGGVARQFHLALAQWSRQIPDLNYYYVTAWEMAQLVHQAEAGRLQPDWSLQTSRQGVAIGV